MKRFKRARDIKVGVIGYGGAFNMGKMHLDLMKRAGMTPVAVADTDTSRLEVAAADLPGIETYASVAKMLRASDVNLVTLVTPHNTHAKLARQCARAGRHVVVEKPMAITTAECDSMIKAARQNRVLVTAFHNRHWDGCVIGALKKLRAGAIGDVVRIEAHMGGYGCPKDWWRSSKSISGGILYDWGVHLLEYTLQIIDSKITEVTGFAKTGFWSKKCAWKSDTNEDEACAMVRFANGAYVNLQISQIESNPKPGAMEIIGTKASYVFDHKSWRLITQKTTREDKNPPSRWDAFYKNIADYLTQGTKLVITPQWSRRPIHILDLAGRSARLGRSLKAKYA